MVEGGFAKFFPNFSYEIKCDKTNKIVEPEGFQNLTRLQVFEKNLKPKITFKDFKTSNVFCVITDYEVYQPNVTGILLGPFPSREIEVPTDIQNISF